MRTRTVFIAVLLMTRAASAFHIVIDPGHGGSDRGAVREHLGESEIVLAISNYLAEDLRRDGRFEVTLTRTGDTFLSLEQRATTANKKGDLFLSIHANSSTDPRARGKEIYFQNQLPPDEETLFLASRENKDLKLDRVVERAVSRNVQSRPHLNSDVKGIVEDLERQRHLRQSAVLAESLHESWQGDKFQRRHAIRQAPFFVVSNLDMPAALIEVGYLSHPQEAKKLATPEYQKRIANGLYKALTQFKEIMDKATPKSLN